MGFWRAVCGEKTTAHDEKFFSLRTATDLQGLDQACLISAKNLWILPKCIKDSVDLPDFVKESVPQIQILCTFQAGLS